MEMPQNLVVTLTNNDPDDNKAAADVNRRRRTLGVARENVERQEAAEMAEVMKVVERMAQKECNAERQRKAATAVERRRLPVVGNENEPPRPRRVSSPALRRSGSPLTSRQQSLSRSCSPSTRRALVAPASEGIDMPRDVAAEHAGDSPDPFAAAAALADNGHIARRAVAAAPVAPGADPFASRTAIDLDPFADALDAIDLTAPRALASATGTTGAAPSD